MKNRSHKYDINSAAHSDRYEYNEYKKCLTMMMLMCVKLTFETRFMNKLTLDDG